MKILKSAPFLLFSAVFAAGLSLPAAATTPEKSKSSAARLNATWNASPRAHRELAPFLTTIFSPGQKPKATANLTKAPYSATTTAPGALAAAPCSDRKPARESNFPAKTAAISPNRLNPVRISKTTLPWKKTFSKPYTTAAAILPLSSWNGWISVSKRP